MTNELETQSTRLVTVDIEKAVATVTLQAAPVNAMSMAMYGAVVDALTMTSARADIRCLILRSAFPGRFCGGADVKELADLTRASPDDAAWETRRQQARAAVEAVQNFPYPTIACIDGYAVGMGFVLASLCDLRFASDRSWFSIPELDVSRCGGARHAFRVLPQAVVRSMYFAGERLTADRAAELGFLNAVCSADELPALVEASATNICNRRTSALRLAKECLNRGQEMSLEDGYTLEQEYSSRLAAMELEGE